ncbi:hypothetical protein [Nocardiopsis aegyptia]|uniref:Uncharacterized protein n=1 Tax=Nocardiopsis aegyptia TaxID=220378 RepID=A0A7Z0ETX8_9ACTN|nr:hypothetical protein [Nocardiopsis aegyptia]NYJ37872.1 hypothetical protein [Nocardiopsis aegyptia]
MRSPDEPTHLVTLAQWARQHGLSESYALRQLPYQAENFPRPESTRTLIRYQHPEPVDLPGHDPRAEVTLGRFATLIGVNRSTVSQYKRKTPDALPDTIEGYRPDRLPPHTRAKFYLEDLLTWWNNRPGSVAGYRSPTGGTASPRRAPTTDPA